MKISDYINRKTHKAQNENISTTDAVAKYSNLSESELMQELFKNAEASRQNGELSNDMLDNFYQQAQGMLTPEQRERMRELIIELKK